MNFDDDDEADFLSTQSTSSNKLASLFKISNDSSIQPGINESLKYKPPKQPNPTNQQPSSQSQMMFFSHVQAFKYLNGHYETQGKLGLVILSSQNTYKLVLYLIKTQPLAMIKLTADFKIALQKNNYASFYDESRQLWSIMFDTDELVVAFATQVTLCKALQMTSNIESANLMQDLKVCAESDVDIVESGDSVEVETLVIVCKDSKLDEIIENTQQKSFKLKLGKNKLPKRVEDSIINMKQGERKLFVFTGNLLAPFFSNQISPTSIVFYDINVLKVKKNDRKERTSSTLMLSNDQMILPQIMTSSNDSDSSRSRADSVKDKTKIINEQLNDPKLDKAKLISRMARMGQPMLSQMPGATHQPSGVIYGIEDEDWEHQHQQMNTSMQDLNSKALRQQHQHFLQHQMQPQQMIYQSLQASPSEASNNNQLALIKAPSPQLLIYPQQQQIVTPHQLQQPPPPHNDVVLNKLEILNEKLDSLKQISQLNNHNMPSMETNILLQNIQRIVKENEQYKKDLYEKSNKIEEQNGKITELLMKAQNYVEQSHQILELKNSAFQTNAEKTVNKVLELEQDKMKLTGDLSKLTANISELNLEINKMQKVEADLKQHLSDVSKNTDMHKQTAERLVIENADLQTKLDNIIAENKKERQLRKGLEAKINLNEEEVNEQRSNLNSYQKLVEEKKRKHELEKALFTRELEDLKAAHEKEIVELKEKLNAFRTKGNDFQIEQIKQLEYDLNNEWQTKFDKSIQNLEQKHERQENALKEERKIFELQLADSKEMVKSLRTNLAKFDAETESLKQKLDESNLIKEKFERLQSKALQMKETYDSRIKELLDAEPDPETIAEELKKVMNLIFRQLKRQIKPDEYYAGDGILSAMLKIIKVFTLRILQSNDGQENSTEEEFDFFSQHIYKVPELSLPQMQSPPSEPKFEIQISQPVQVISDQTLSNATQKAVDQTDSTAGHAAIDESETIKLDPDLNSFQPKSNTLTTTTISTNSRMNPTGILFSHSNDNENNDNDDEDDDDDDRSIQLINDEDEEKIMNESLNKTDTETTTSVYSTIKPENELSQIAIEKSVSDTIYQTEEEKHEVEENTLQEENEIFQEREMNAINNQELNLNDISINKIPVNNIGQISPLQLDENEKPILQEVNPVKLTVKASKGLFDDEEEDNEENESVKLFSSQPVISKIKEETNELTTSNTTNTNTTATSVNLKFSPPPLFSNEDDDDSNEKDIDWFK